MQNTAIYVRVSTKDQSTANQLRELRAYAQRRKLTVFHIYEDKGISGAKRRRPALDQLMTDAHARLFDAVLVWKFDRFARSVSHLVEALNTFKSLGIDFISLTEQIDTSTPAGEMVFHVMASVAQFERDLIRERVQAGMRRAKANGKHIGRPRLVWSLGRARQLADQGCSVTDIAKTLKVSRSTVFRAISKAA